MCESVINARQPNRREFLKNFLKRSSPACKDDRTFGCYLSPIGDVCTYEFGMGARVRSPLSGTLICGPVSSFWIATGHPPSTAARQGPCRGNRKATPGG